MLELNKENFQELVLKQQGLVLVDYWSPKCEPCMELLPQVMELEKQFSAIVFGKVNILENRRLAIGQKVMGLPTIVIYRNGEQVVSLSKDFSIEDVIASLQAQI